MIISSLINFVEDKTHIPILAISGVAITSGFITQVSTVFGFITIVTTAIAASVTATIKICELVRKIKKWNKENVDDKK